MLLSGTTLVSSVNHENIGNPMSHYPSLYEDSKAYCNNIMGDFPSPKEIARLDEKYLAKRCCLGYRARRILKLAQAVDDGSIKLSKLEELCSEASLTNCNKVDGMLKEINGFGPFTRGNVLMCMGFYNVVPTDSETIRHLKQVHARATTIGTVKEVVEEIYGHYEPYQFLAYWSELWSFYEGWFGKLSEMSSSDYRLITASNMKTQRKYIK
uniref:HhH-GPD domain-containing protein n=1 Tax=Opuntia streptacantha TaxID=393608 RepID=A0A7C8ZJF6_OPUST